MAFSFYASLKSIPKEMREAAKIYRFSWWQRFTQMELPFSAIGLVWNSMMSVAGGWFALMVCEMFVLGSRDFRLPGLGSYLQTAASAGDTRFDFLGRCHDGCGDRVAGSIGVAAGDCVGGEIQSRAGGEHGCSAIMGAESGAAFERARQIRQKTLRPLSERLLLYFARKHSEERPRRTAAPWRDWLLRGLALLVLVGIGYGVVRVAIILSGLRKLNCMKTALGLGATFLRVNLALLIGALWTIPAGVAIGFNPRLARIAQPLAQIAASVPATALLPVILLVLIRLGGGLGMAPSSCCCWARSGMCCST